ncbi:hypothetical protein KGQ55_00705 [Patescibacteria group bacterium]|nr:hypothetical protein [Patescibacteria group bacterium]
MSEKQARRRAYADDTAAVRAALHCLRNTRGRNVLIMPYGIAQIHSDDMAILSEDIELLLENGVPVIVAEAMDAMFWNGLPDSIYVQSVVRGNEKEYVAGIANECNLHKLILLCEGNCTLADGTVLNNASVSEVRKLIADGKVSRDWTLTLDLAANACERAVETVHLFDAHHPHALLAELLTASGSGTFVHSDMRRFKFVRKAELTDVPEIKLFLGEDYAGDQGRERIMNTLEQYRVFTVDEATHGCALYSFQEGTAVMTNVAYSRFDGEEALAAMLDAFLAEASNRGASCAIVPLDGLPEALRNSECFERLSFSKQGRLPGRSGTAWVK